MPEKDEDPLSTRIDSITAVRLLCNAVQSIHHLDVTREGYSPPCKNAGELVLQKALVYLAHGDVPAVQELIGRFEEWKKTGKAGWPYDGE